MLKFINQKGIIMKKVLTLSLSLLTLVCLSGCSKKPVVIQEDVQPAQEKPKAIRTAKNNRISGPMAEKEIGWDQEDLA
jgi:hypothetical protein